MTSTILWDDSQQGTDAWMAARAGAITGSRVKDALDRLKNGSMSDKAMSYAHDLARQRVGGKVPPVFENAYMREGSKQEPLARIQYELRSGNIVEEVGFAHTNDRKFGCSPDGLIDSDGLWECKTMVSSKTLFTALVGGDVAEYRHQCVFEMWLLSRRWCDLTLWCADLGILKTVRIERDEAEIEKMVEQLVEFDRFVETLAGRLRALIAEHGIDALPQAEEVAAPLPEAA